MRTEDNSIFDEINEELKHDEVLAFIKKHQDSFFWLVVLIVAGIMIHSSWYSRKKQRLEISTTSLFQEIYSTSKKSDAAIDNLLQNAPSELIPLLSVIRSGRKISAADDVQKHTEELLALSEKRGVDPVWKDLALIIYVSYRAEPNEKSLKRLEPLCEDGRPFKYTAIEMSAMIYESMGNHAKAIELLSSIVEAKDSPKSMQTRIAKMINYIKNKPNAKEGTVIGNY